MLHWRNKKATSPTNKSKSPKNKSKEDFFSTFYLDPQEKCEERKIVESVDLEQDFLLINTTITTTNNKKKKKNMADKDDTNNHATKKELTREQLLTYIKKQKVNDFTISSWKNNYSVN